MCKNFANNLFLKRLRTVVSNNLQLTDIQPLNFQKPLN